MANQKVTDLTAITTVAAADVIYIVDDPGGTPLPRKITIANLLKEAVEYGQIYTDDGSGNQSLSSGAFTKLTQFDTDGLSSTNVTPDATNNKITLVSTGHYFVFFSLSFDGTATVDWEFAAFLAASEQAAIQGRSTIGSTPDEVCCSGFGIINNSSASQDLDLRAEPDGASKTINILEASMVAIRLPN